MTPVRIVVGIIALAAVVVGVAFAGRFGSDPRLGPSPLVGRSVPDVTVDLIDDGGPLALRDLAGDVAVVNFWAPWCIPCRAEHSDLLAAASAYGEGVTVLGVAYQSRPGDVGEFLDELGRGYPVAMDHSSRAAIEFGVRGVPETYFIGADGVVLAKVSGPVDAGLLSAALDAILLGGEVDSVETGEVQISP